MNHVKDITTSAYCQGDGIIGRGGGALEYESDGYVPTGERKHGAFDVNSPPPDTEFRLKAEDLLAVSVLDYILMRK